MRPILVPTDFSTLSSQALKVAMKWCHYFDRKPHLIHVDQTETIINSMPLYAGALPDFEKVEGKQIEKNIRKYCQEQLDGIGIKQPIEFTVLHGYPGKALVEYSTKHPPWMIIVGAHGHGFLNRFILGSVTEKLIKSSKCPVAIIRGEEAATPKTILVPIDFSMITEKSLSTAAELARNSGAKLRLLHVLPTELRDYILDYPYSFSVNEHIEGLYQERCFMAHEQMKTCVESLKKNKLDVKGEVLVVEEGDVITEIIKYSKDLSPDVTILGAHKHGKVFDFFIGSNTTKLLRELTESLIVVK